MGDQKKHPVNVSDSFERMDEKFDYEVSFRRWLVREIEEGRMTTMEAVKEFNFHPTSGRNKIWEWRKKYRSGMFLSLPIIMTEQEKQDLSALQKQLKAMEKQLEDARMRNIALNTLIDVAEEKLKIDIRKKPGAKQ